MWSLASVLNKTVGLCLRADFICYCVGTCCGCVTAGERALERTAERAAERVGERAFERTAERAAERALERTAGMPLGVGLPASVVVQPATGCKHIRLSTCSVRMNMIWPQPLGCHR